MSGTETQQRLDKAKQWFNEELADHESKTTKSACKSLKDGKTCTNKVMTL